ncbi:MAG: response regulator transcription factor [Gemmatimonadaceae bacterium]|jgi:two-component system LytT family response regulator|nr:response regulator transcription factor [Gemmatimonadaceae bacterium]
MPPTTGVTTLICDDEPIARAGLRQMLASYDWIRVVGEAPHGLAAVEAINHQQPELVFLDIQMPGLLGTEVLARLTHQPFVVFTTAYGEHAVTAFELGAVDYLLKPFGEGRLGAAMERVRAALGEPTAAPSLDRLGEALRSGPMTRLFVRHGSAILPLPVASIAWFEADGDYVVAQRETGRHWVHLSLNRLATRLDPAQFVRIHRTHIVNLDYVVAFRRHGRSGMTAEMRGGVQLAVSRQRAAALRTLGV